MARSNEATQSQIPAAPDMPGWRHFGDAIAGPIVASRIQGFNLANADYRDVAVDANGALQLAANVSVDLGTIDQGTAAAAAGAWPMKLTDGTNIAAIRAGSSLPAASDTAQVVTLRDTAAVTATLAAETTKVLGVTRTADGAGNLLTSTTNALDVNIKSGNPTTIAVTQATAASLNATVAAPVGTPVFTRLSDGAAALIGQKAMTASLPVVLASDQASVPVAATLAAETTKVIGVVRSADGSGNLLTSTSNALDVNLKTSAASNISTNVAQVAGTATAVNSGTLTAGTQRVVLATDQPALTNSLLVTAGGPVAAAASASGNPLVVGGDFNTTPPTYTNGQRGTMQLDSRGMPMVALWDGTGATRAAVLANADGMARQNGLAVNSFGQLWNGTNADLARGNSNGVTGDSGAKATGAFLGATQTNYNARGAIITCVVGTVTGAVTTWQTGIQWSFDGGTTWLELTPLGANDTAVSSGKTYTWIIYPTNTSQAAGTTPATLVPGTITVTGPTQLNVVNAALPRTWRFAAQVSVVTSIAITSVNINYIL